MSLSQSTEISSSKLEFSRAETPLPHPHPPPPEHELRRYGNEPLPPLPHKRASGVSDFSEEMNDALALATPRPLISPDEGSIEVHYCESASDPGSAEIFQTTDKRTDIQNRPGPRVNTADVPGALPETPISPQGKASVPKIAKHHEVLNAPTFKETTPTGHNPEKKIQRLTGLGVAPELVEQQMLIRNKQHQLDGGLGDSPTSTVSGNSCSEGTRTPTTTAVADAEGREGSSEPSAGYIGFSPSHRRSTGSTAIPSPLRIIKTTRPSRSLERKCPATPGCRSPRIESERRGPKPHRNTPTFTLDPYHKTAMELAGVAQNVQPSDRANMLAAQQFREAGGASSPDSHRSPRGKQLPHPHYALEPRPSNSAEQLHPVWHPQNYNRNSPRSVSASTFGRLPHWFHARHSASSSLSPDPRPRSKFEYDSDNSYIAGTSDTVGSIPISIASDISVASPGDSTTRRRRHSNFIMAKVFRRASGSPMTATPPPVLNSTPQQTSPSPSPSAPHHHHPFHFRRHHLSSSTLSRPSSHQPPPSNALLPTGRSRVDGTDHQPPSKVKARSSLSASSLAAKTTDLLDAAAGFLLQKSSASLGHIHMSGEERRRQRLKSSIRVLGDGGQVPAPASVPVSGSGPGSGTETGTGTGAWAEGREGVGVGTGGGFS